MPFSLGNQAKNQSITTTSGTITISLSAGSVVVVQACLPTLNATGATSISSVTSAHLTFTKRSAQTRHNAKDSVWVRLETWWANVPSSLTSEVITVTLSIAPNSGTDGGVALAIECKGLGQPSSPYDANASIPNFNQGQNSISQTSSPNITTNSHAPVGIVSCATSQTTAGEATTPGTWDASVSCFGATTASPRTFFMTQVFASQQVNQNWNGSGFGTDTDDWLWNSDAFFGVGVPVSGWPPFDIKAH